MTSILALAPYPKLSADTRYRIAQFIPELERAGWNVLLLTFMDERFFNIYNLPGHTIEKIIKMGISSFKRFLDVWLADQFDAVLLHKEAFPFGPPLMEHLIKFKQPKIIYDMDDAFWTHPPQLKQIGRLCKDPDRIKKIISLSSHVLAGNQYLAEYANRYNPNVTVFPTVVDTNRYYLRDEIDDGYVMIGWVGRWSSSFYLESHIPLFQRISAAYPEVRYTFIGAAPFDIPDGLPVVFKPWRLESEIEDLIQFDIGIMPLPDDIYAKGKCGFKLLQYMGLGIPAVASPVGVNQEIIKDGENGFLASSEDAWFETLSTLISNKKLRQDLGAEGRQTVKKQYSLKTSLPILIDLLDGILN